MNNYTISKRKTRYQIRTAPDTNRAGEDKLEFHNVLLISQIFSLGQLIRMGEGTVMYLYFQFKLQLYWLLRGIPISRNGTDQIFLR